VTDKTPRANAASEHLKTVAQVIAIAMLAGILLMVFHKGYVDFSALAREHRGSDFWLAFAKYLFKNLAGG
jgi:hypothetical protein